MREPAVLQGDDRFDEFLATAAQVADRAEVVPVRGLPPRGVTRSPVGRVAGMYEMSFLGYRENDRLNPPAGGMITGRRPVPGEVVPRTPLGCRPLTQYEQLV